MKEDLTINNCINHYLSFESGKSCPDSIRDSSQDLLLYAPNFIEEIYEITVIDYIKELIPDGEVFIDVGSHIGFYKVGLSRNFKKIFSFEPSPFQNQYLERNVLVNNLHNVSISNNAVSNATDKNVDLFIMGRSGGTNTIEVSCANDAMSKTTVRTISLDSCLFEDLSFLKIDVEGHEIEVLKGAINTIKLHKPIILCEVWDNTEARMEFSKVMESMDYEYKFLFKHFPELAICQSF